MTASLWYLGLAASAVITLSFGAIAVRLALDLSRSAQWTGNPLGVATTFIFVTCAASHGVRTVQLLGPAVLGPPLPSLAAQVEYGWFHMIALDAVTAFAGVWYWTMRRRYPSLARGAAMFEDLRSRNREALAINDDIVQGLSEAKLALEAGEDEVGEAALEDTLDDAKGLITDLLDTERSGVRPGQLRREEP